MQKKKIKWLRTSLELSQGHEASSIFTTLEIDFFAQHILAVLTCSKIPFGKHEVAGIQT